MTIQKCKLTTGLLQLMTAVIDATSTSLEGWDLTGCEDAPRPLRQSRHRCLVIGLADDLFQATGRPGSEYLHGSYRAVPSHTTALLKLRHRLPSKEIWSRHCGGHMIPTVGPEFRLSIWFIARSGSESSPFWVALTPKPETHAQHKLSRHIQA